MKFVPLANLSEPRMEKVDLYAHLRNCILSSDEYNRIPIDDENYHDHYLILGIILSQIAPGYDTRFLFGINEKDAVLGYYHLTKFRNYVIKERGNVEKQIISHWS
jgi:hypothetical protein